MSSAREPLVNVRKGDNGELILTSGYEVKPTAANLAELFLEQSIKHEQRTLLADKNQAGVYEALTYGEVRRQAMSVASWLLNEGAGPETPLLILSGASKNHLAITLGAMLAKVPTVPASMSYSTVPAAFPKLNAIIEKTNPRFFFSDDFTAQRAALDSMDLSSRNIRYLDSRDMSSLTSDVESDQLQSVITSITPDTVHKYMFTSGSTGNPKGVIHTHGMMTAMIAARDVDEPEVPPRVLDWMPWSHVGAGVLRLYSIISQGGCIYIDEGKPTLADYDKTLVNLRQVKPTMYAGAPLGWNMLVNALERDEQLAHSFFENLTSLAYGSAAMPTSTYERLQALLVKHQGERKAMSTSLQSTEVAVGISRYWPCEDQTVVGLPMPGAELKLLPVGDRYELRVKSVGVTPGYINDPEKSQEAFDDQGFFKMGDAVTFADENDPSKGLRFAGRIAEQFKLVTGTWVAAGTLRSQLVAACAPYVRDVVICGINQPYLGALIWLNVENAAEVAGSVEPGQQVANKLMVEQVRSRLLEHNQKNTGSSQSIKKFVLLSEPPSVGDGEITDKGYVNQGAVQRNRVKEVEALFQDKQPRFVISV